jgi:nucleotide-binding universal stress UspA family protein
LGFAARLAETLHASLTACHCSPANWFTADNQLPHEQYDRLKDSIKAAITQCEGPSSTLTWRSVVIESSFDPARDILNVARESDADLIVMKARPGVLSAFRFGSIVERIIEGSNLPVLLLPSAFLANRDPAHDALEFRRILFDYDFSEATDQLFRIANALTRGYDAELYMLSVLEPTSKASIEAAPLPFSRPQVQTIVRQKLGEVLESEGRSIMDVRTVVEWGRHAETVLEHTRNHDIDLICTTLAPPHFYFEKLYSAYLGSLLKSARCPILVKQSLQTGKIKDLER